MLPSMSRRMRLGGLVLLLVWIGLMIWSIVPSYAASLPQIVQPDDVATPTATYTIILIPTATPTPIAESPLTDFVLSGSEMAPVGLHGAENFSAYTVRVGDTLLSVALEVGVDVEDLPCAVSPHFRPDQPLVIGDQLEVPPASWQCHQMGADESLTQVAARYGLDPIQIINVAWNQLDANALGQTALPVGSYVRIPPVPGDVADGGFLNFMLDQPLSVSPMTAYAIGGPRVKTATAMGPVPKDWPYGSGNFMWPVYGWMSQGYRNDHRAIDIAAVTGTFVTAADRGVVIRAGWNEQGYGMFVVIDHNIDYITLYAHLYEVYVKEGDIVDQGQIIGAIGSTGNSTGPHLHFEIRDFGRRTNPLDLLMR
jgi:murein DD-endopeptidase MepM/ murein hydrolase activator NlpD